MSPLKQQKRIILGLETGRKLHEVLQEPNMPTKKQVDEWCLTPEFSDKYQEAIEQGKARRLSSQGSVEEQRARLSSTLTKIIGDGGTYQRPAATPQSKPENVLVSPVETHQLQAGEWVEKTVAYRIHQDADGNETLSKTDEKVRRLSKTTAELQQEVLTSLREGVLPKDVLKQVVGFSGLKLAGWRKEPGFAQLHDAAKATGRARARELRQGSVLTSATPPAPTPPAPLVPEPAPAPSPPSLVAAAELTPCQKPGNSCDLNHCDTNGCNERFRDLVTLEFPTVEIADAREARNHDVAAVTPPPPQPELIQFAVMQLDGPLLSQAQAEALAREIVEQGGGRCYVVQALSTLSPTVVTRVL